MAMQVIKTAGDLFHVGFYNVGLQQPSLENKKVGKATARIQKLSDDIGNAFRNHNLDLLGLCELGEHLVGLDGKNISVRKLKRS